MNNHKLYWIWKTVYGSKKVKALGEGELSASHSEETPLPCYKVFRLG
jgi:hypothetical protein